MAVVAADLVERWREMGPVLWLAAAAVAALWFLLFGLMAALTEPRKVDPGAETLDLGGPEPPAVVALIAGDWRLGHEALPATLLDLAARRHVAVEQVGDVTYVRVPKRHTAADDPLTSYEDMVLRHVRTLCTQGNDRVVPAEALTTGPDHASKGWWRIYRKAVEADARNRGLSRPRWSRGIHALLAGSALAVAFAVGLAVSTLPNNDDTTGSSSSSSDDGNPVTAALGLGVVTWGALIAAVEAAGNRQRDTPAGREAAARWLGLREMLAQNTLFAEQPPAGVAIWDRHIAYGAALGVAHGAVAALPLGAESDDTAWSSLGGRWRVVHIRYPNLVPPGYGRHPFRATAVGLLQAAVATWVLVKVPPALHQAVDDVESQGFEVAASSGVALGVDIAATVISAVAGLFAARAFWMLIAGLADLVGGRRPVEGRVLRFRVRGSDKQPRWYMAVDDGTTDRLRAWRFHSVQLPNQGEMVRASVSPRLQHVKELTVASPPPPNLPHLPDPSKTPTSTAPGTYTHEMTASGE